MKASVWGLDPATYVAHPLHRGDRVWPETNCYADLVIELVHAAGLEPIACLGHTLAIDFEGDQFTFFKPPLGDVIELYGLDTQELSIYRPPADHAAEQVARGRVVLMEVDAFFLPDVAGTSYHADHAKTTIGIETIDPEDRRVGYFHNAGYHALSGADYDGLFRVGAPRATADDHLPPYTEYAKVDRLRRDSEAELVAIAVAQARRHLARRPTDNPFAGWRPRFLAEVDALKAAGLGSFHPYAFATIRQFGAGFGLGAELCAWLAARGHADLAAPATDLRAVAETGKALQFKLARAVQAKRAVDFSEPLDELERRWESAMTALASSIG